MLFCVDEIVKETCSTNNKIKPIGHLDVIKYLYNTGKCDLFIKTTWGDTPLDRARLLGHHEVVEFITNVLTTTSTLTCK